MTAIANWVNKENNQKSIWTIGDTKISDLSSKTSLSLESSKIFELQIICKDIEDENIIYLLGDKKIEIAEEIKSQMKFLENEKNLDYWRTPLKVISEIITSGKYESIGGGTQLNIATVIGCNPYQSVGEEKMSFMKFRNIDIHYDIGHQVGNCVIAIDGMDFRMR